MTGSQSSDEEDKSDQNMLLTLCRHILKGYMVYESLIKFVTSNTRRGSTELRDNRFVVDKELQWVGSLIVQLMQPQQTSCTDTTKKQNKKTQQHIYLHTHQQQKKY